MLRQRCAQLGNARPQQLPVIGIKGRLADAGSKALQSDAANQKLAIGRRELIHRRMDGKRAFRNGH